MASIRRVCPDRCPVKPGRLGDKAAVVNVESIHYRRRITQCRRLQHFARLPDQTTSHSVVVHRVTLWAAMGPLSWRVASSM